MLATSREVGVLILGPVLVSAWLSCRAVGWLAIQKYLDPEVSRFRVGGAREWAELDGGMGGSGL